MSNLNSLKPKCIRVYSPTGIALDLRNVNIQLPHPVSECRLTFDVDFTTYKRIEEKRLFHLSPQIKCLDSTPVFLPEFDITIEVYLAPDLLPLLDQVNITQSDNAIQYLKQLNKNHPKHNDLLCTENWLALSVHQPQKNGKVGYRTLWSYLNWQLTPEQQLDTDNLSEAVSAFLGDAFASKTLSELDPLGPEAFNIQIKHLMTTLGQGTGIVDGLNFGRQASRQANSQNEKHTKTNPQESLNEAIVDLMGLLTDLAQEERDGEAAQNKPHHTKSSEVTRQKTTQKKTGHGQTTQPQTTNHVVIDKEKPLSQSQLWQRQRSYFQSHYLDHSPSANGKDEFNTTSLAHGYADLIVAFLRDSCAVTKRHKSNFSALDKTEPIYIIELGAGAGRFAYRHVQRLQQLLTHPTLKKLTIKYVITDFTDQSLTYWQQHHTLQPLFEEGILDLARFDLENPAEIALQHSGKVLTTETLCNPLIVIANDVFSCLPQDVYRISDGTLQKSIVSLLAPTDTPLKSDVENNQALSQLSLQYQHQPVDKDCVDNESPIYRYYQTLKNSLENSHILWPTVACQGLDYLRSLAGDRLMLLSSDIAYCHAVALHNTPEPSLNENSLGQGSVDGYVSFPVNYHALADYTQHQNGQSLQPATAMPGLSTQVLLFGDHPTGFRETQSAYEHQDRCASGWGHKQLSDLDIEQLETLSLLQLVTYLQTHHWDTEIFLACFSALLPHLDSAPLAIRHDIIQGIHQAWQSYYPSQPTGTNPDVAFYLGMVLYTLADYTDAIQYFERSRQSHGDDPSTLYNLAIGHYRCGQIQPAITYLKETLTLDHTFESAQILLQELT